jgi:DNA repair protein RecN (Recombination protein N)
MIKLLRINNIAVIPQLELEFEPGLTLLTGETGAGKSIVIDALGLLLGDRASADVIRTGEERATVEGVFEADLQELRALLAEHGIDGDEGEVVIRREVLSSGKGRATVNGALVPVSVLKELGPHLAVIHGQHEPHGLLDPASHLALVDAHAGAGVLREQVSEVFAQVRSIDQRLEALKRDRRDAERRREMLDFQAAEIEKAALQPGEEETLRREKQVLANAGRLATLSGEAYGMLYEDEAAVVAGLGQVFRKVEELGAIDPAFAPYLEMREGVRAQLEDLAYFLRDYQGRLNVTPGRLDEVEGRLATIERLKRKYGESVDAVLAFGEQCRREAAELGDPEETERALTEERAAVASLYLEGAVELSRQRRAAALSLEKKVAAELGQLAMERTRFKVRFEPEAAEGERTPPEAWASLGLETAEFLLAPNQGEELRPLARIASGGELSRVMLALKSVATVDAQGKALVFDEVDAGIGGRVAEVVGKKLKAMAARHQVLCVTHLPQIASLADAHWAVRKKVERGRTVTEVHVLGKAERIEEIARMLGGETVTDAARQHAREMVKQSLRS